MDDDNSQILTGLPEGDGNGVKTLRFSEKLGIKDEYAGDKIKDLADKTGFVGMVGSLILGLVIWNRVLGLTGFLFGFLIAGAGIFASFVLVSVLYSYGDMIANSVEQTRILKRLEERKLADQKRLEQIEARKKPAPETKPAEQTENKNELQAESEDEDTDSESDAAESKPAGRLRKIARIPLRGVIDARMRRLAHFSERSPHGIICPVCGRKQESERDNCYFCDCRFEYDDDPFLSDDDVVLDRLRHLVDK